MRQESHVILWIMSVITKQDDRIGDLTAVSAEYLLVLGRKRG